MITATLTVRRCGYAVVQDLGRPGYTAIGISGNGAGDQASARLANTLVGNADTAPLLETIASDLDVTTDTEALIAVSGAADSVLVDNVPHPASEALFVPAGASIRIAAPAYGHRSYLAINGDLAADRALGSVAPDPLLGVGRTLSPGDQLSVTTGFDGQPVRGYLPLLRLGAPTRNLGTPCLLEATPGPDLDRLEAASSALASDFTVSPQSNNVGIRLTGGDLRLTSQEEILSRGVPVGAVEVPPSGELIILMRGRLVTAGYTVVAVLTRASIDRAAQVRPGDVVRLRLVDLAQAQAQDREAVATHLALAQRMANAMRARGLAHVLSPAHASSFRQP